MRRSEGDCAEWVLSCRDRCDLHTVSGAHMSLSCQAGAIALGEALQLAPEDGKCDLRAVCKCDLPTCGSG